MKELRELSVDDNSYLLDERFPGTRLAHEFDDEHYIERYLQLPDQLPERVVKLARELTSDVKDPVDQALVLRNYLRNSYPYTLDPPPVPGGTDFVDYFLFEEQRGYCTYHSTALVILLRAVDLPARWVAGYVVRDNEEKRLSPGVDYEVTNATAHAWVEVLIPGYGWVSLDPTPRFAGFERVESLPERAAPGDEVPYQPDGNQGLIGPDEGWRDDLSPGDEGLMPSPAQPTPLWVYALGLLLLWLAALLGQRGYWLWQSYRADRYALSGPAGPVRLFGHAFELLRELGIEVGEHMTAREVLGTLRSHTHTMPEVTNALETLVPILERYLYAGARPVTADLEDIDRAWAKAVGRLRQVYGLRRMLRARLQSR